ncbi:hypothetical protein ABEB36_003118 [Hypothenemus hampei]|uniref:RRM domain-containing protein n=1 Tax=Hypothenemus hampei TaxID=57062 RepID=A0ABD1F8H1_HYPHA
MVRGDSNKNRGFGFVTYLNKVCARKALVHLEKKAFLCGEPLFVQMSLDNCRIFLGGISIYMTKDDVWKELSSCYGVTNIVDVIMYRKYGQQSQNRGFAFLEFRTHEEAAYFRSKFQNKLILFGYKLLVDWSIPVMENDYDDSSNEDFAYIHLNTREDAELLLEKLKCFYQNTLVEVSFSKPQNKFNQRNYRDKVLSLRSAQYSSEKYKCRSVSNFSPCSISPITDYGENSLPLYYFETRRQLESMRYKLEFLQYQLNQASIDSQSSISRPCSSYMGTEEENTDFENTRLVDTNSSLLQ